MFLEFLRERERDGGEQETKKESTLIVAAMERAKRKRRIRAGGVLCCSRRAGHSDRKARPRPTGVQAGAAKARQGAELGAADDALFARRPPAAAAAASAEAIISKAASSPLCCLRRSSVHSTATSMSPMRQSKRGDASQSACSAAREAGNDRAATPIARSQYGKREDGKAISSSFFTLAWSHLCSSCGRREREASGEARVRTILESLPFFVAGFGRKRGKRKKKVERREAKSIEFRSLAPTQVSLFNVPTTTTQQRRRKRRATNL